MENATLQPNPITSINLRQLLSSSSIEVAMEIQLYLFLDILYIQRKKSLSSSDRRQLELDLKSLSAGPKMVLEYLLTLQC